MDPFPPGFPFVSRNPEPAPEPEAAAPDPVAPDAACEPAPAAEPETPSFASRQSSGTPDDRDPQPAAEREPWPFPKRDVAPVPAADTDAVPRTAEREPWPFPRRNRQPDAVTSEVVLAPEAQRETAAPQTARSAPEPSKIVPVAAPVVKNERRKIRRDGLNTAALLRVDGVHGPPLKIELCDISIAGARFRSPQKLDLGEKAQVRVEVGPFRWTTRLRVVHCEPLDDGGASIGCAFLRTELLRPWPVAA